LATLVLDLQDGFADDTVTIHIDGKEKYHKLSVSTDYALGLADSVKIQVPNGSIQIQIKVLSRHISELVEQKVSETVYLGVSILEDRIHHQISDERFTYL
jgi:hypothetical protein